MTKAEDAVALFQQGFNCTQSILSVFAADFGLDRHKARRISQGFGAGMGRTDNICGSLSAAIMLIGYGTAAYDRRILQRKKKPTQGSVNFYKNLRRSMVR